MKKPEELIAGIDRSILGRALLGSFIAHAVLLGGTSSKLYADWAKYGVHAPSYINSLKIQERKEAEAATRKAAAEEKSKEEAAKSAAAATNKTAQASVQTNKTALEAAPMKATAVVDGDQKTPPEDEPLPPKKDFEYGEDLSLD